MKTQHNMKPPRRHRVQYALSLSIDQRNAIKRIANSEGISMSQVILNQLLGNQKDKNLSRSNDDVLSIVSELIARSAHLIKDQK